MRRRFLITLLLIIIFFTSACNSNKKTISLPILPLTLNSDLPNEVIITDISYKLADENLFIFFICKKTDKTDVNMKFINIQVSLRNSTGNIIDAKQLTITDFNNKESICFHNASEKASSFKIDIKAEDERLQNLNNKARQPLKH